MTEEGQPKRQRKWVKRCGKGCAGIVAFILIITFVMFLFRGFFGGIVCSSFAERFTANFERAQQDGQISGQAEEVFHDLMVSIGRHETSISAVTYACILLDRCLKAPDEALRERAIAAATDMRELLAVEPSAGIRAMKEIMEKYPELNVRNWNARQRPAPAPQS